jgi:putative ABC transport system substrate-binding protein
MKKIFVCLVLGLFFFLSCQKESSSVYTIGIFQVNDAPTMNVTRESFVQALKDNGLRDSENIRLIIRNAMGDIPETQRLAQEFVTERVDECSGRFF